MALAIFSCLQSLWPFSLLKADDLKISSRLVGKLSIPDQTKRFVFAFSEPDSDVVVYILAAQSLSQQSALDAEYLIKEVKPKVVVAQTAHSALADIQAEEKCLRNGELNSVPTSSLGVLKRCFTEKMNKNHFERFAGCQVLQEIFGVGFYGHLLSPKRAAEEIGSQFLLIESRYQKFSASMPGDDEALSESSGLHIQSNGLVPGKFSSAFCSSFKRLCIINPDQKQLIKSVIPYLDFSISKENLFDAISQEESRKCQPDNDYQAPSFAQSVYPLLQDLHDIFVELPSVGKALMSAQKMLVHVNGGKPVDIQTLSDVYSFRVAVEFLREALNNMGRCPIDRVPQNNSTNLQFFDLPAEEQSNVLLVQTLKSQAKKFGSLVAIVDASCLVGLRRHWNTSVPLEVADMIDPYCDVDHEGALIVEENGQDSIGKKGLLVDKPVVTIGAGATAILGASSLPKALHASTFINLATSKIPAFLNFGFAQLQRLGGVGLGKILGSSKLFTHGVIGAGTKSSAVKFTASAEKIRVLTHSVIASAERTSLLAMRTSFYEIMRRRHARPIRFAPLATFSCSMAVCAGLIVSSDGIEYAAELMPSIPTIASLGRGLQNLQQASKEVRQISDTKIQEALNSFMHKLQKMKAQ